MYREATNNSARELERSPTRSPAADTHGIGSESVVIDGAMGEGGGQVLRTSLSLSIMTGRPLRIVNIRARRPKPGLARQHVSCVRAAREICAGTASGDELGSSQVEFHPGPVTPSHLRVAMPTGGSTTLVLQTVLWPLLMAAGPSTIDLHGGTHNPMAPPFEFIELSLLPILEQMGATIRVECLRHGFSVAGGGHLRVHIMGGASLHPVQLHARGNLEDTYARAVHAHLPARVGSLELHTLRRTLGLGHVHIRACAVESDGPGNVVLVVARHDHGHVVISSVGQRSVRAERVASSAATAYREFASCEVPVCEHLADQLLIPLALAGGGSFRTTRPTLHTTTNAALIERWLPVRFAIEQESERVWSVRVEQRTR